MVFAAQLDRERETFRESCPNVDWAALRDANKPVALCIRVSPYPGPFLQDDAAFRAISASVAGAIDRALRAGVDIAEVQLDFDCGEAKLSGYKIWLEAFRKIVAPRRAVFTALPYWLNHTKEFAALCAQSDGFVLQVHSFEFGQRAEKRSLCDVEAAKRWLERASRFGVPFEVALPTYRSEAGFGPDGKILGVVSESSRPQWPKGTKVVASYSDPAELSQFVRWLDARHPDQLRGILWFRMPVSTDRNNWDLATLRRVMAGEEMQARFQVRMTGDNPVDLSIVNSGDCEGFMRGSYATGIRSDDVAFQDALPGWELSAENGLVVARRFQGKEFILCPGQASAIGWLRLKTRSP